MFGFPWQATLHMVMYVPAPHHQPCLLLDEDGKPVPSQAFFVENWGGVYIHSTPHPPSPGRHTLTVKELGAPVVPLRHFCVRSSASATLALSPSMWWSGGGSELDSRRGRLTTWFGQGLQRSFMGPKIS